MPFSWKRFFALFSKFFAPFTQSTVRNTKISGYVCFTLPTGFKQMNGLLLEFLGVGRLRFAHKTLLCLFYHISLLRPPNFGGIPLCCWSFLIDLFLFHRLFHLEMVDGRGFCEAEDS